MSQEKLYRPDQLAERVGVHVETIRRWIREGRIRHIKFPKFVRIPEAEFDRVLMYGPRPKGKRKNTTQSSRL